MYQSKIDYCKHTLNIVTGCQYGCEYCYAPKMMKRFSGNVKQHLAQTDKYTKENEGYVLEEPFLDEEGRQVHYPFGFEPTYHKYRFGILDKYKNGTNFLVGAMGDLFGEFIQDKWIKEVMTECWNHPKNNYLFLTRNPKRYKDFAYNRANMYYGTTITKKTEMENMFYLPENRKTFVAIEPILEDFKEDEIFYLVQTNWIIIGAETGNRADKVVPEKAWIDKIVRKADQFGTPVFMQDSLIDIMGEENMRRDYPKKLKSMELSDKLKRKMITQCVICKKEDKKTEMYTISIRKKRGYSVKRLCHVCDECLKKFCEEYDVEMPDLKED